MQYIIKTEVTNPEIANGTRLKQFVCPARIHREVISKAADRGTAAVNEAEHTMGNNHEAEIFRGIENNPFCNPHTAPSPIPNNEPATKRPNGDFSFNETSKKAEIEPISPPHRKSSKYFTQLS